MSMNDYERELAKCEDFDIRDNEHGGLCLGGSFDFDGSSQGFGYQIDIEFVQKFMEVFGVTHLQAVNGKSCWVTHTYDSIKLVEPLHKKDGVPFDVQAWAKEAQARAKACEPLKKSR